MNLKRVDFVWINRDQKSFEWFVNLLSNLEDKQSKFKEEDKRILNFHMYITSVTAESDIRSLVLQLALDMTQEKDKKDFITGLKQKVHSGRPDWNKVGKI
jgi:hypothetical protein